MRGAVHAWSIRCVAVALVMLPALVLATDVRVVAVAPGRSADVVIGGKEPMTIEIGQTIDGVHVLGVDATGAVMTVDGATKRYPLASARSMGHAMAAGSVTLKADPSGHFITTGAINGKNVTFVVDTGATAVALSAAEAARIGLQYRGGKAMVAMTANGAVRGWQVTLASVRLGDMTVSNVEGMVIDANLGPVLLGMTFLDRFDMIRQGSTLVLRRSTR